MGPHNRVEPTGEVPGLVIVELLLSRARDVYTDVDATEQGDRLGNVPGVPRIHCYVGSNPVAGDPGRVPVVQDVEHHGPVVAGPRGRVIAGDGRIGGDDL